MSKSNSSNEISIYIETDCQQILEEGCVSQLNESSVNSIWCKHIGKKSRKETLQSKPRGWRCTSTDSECSTCLDSRQKTPFSGRLGTTLYVSCPCRIKVGCLKAVDQQRDLSDFKVTAS